MIRLRIFQSAFYSEYARRGAIVWSTSRKVETMKSLQGWENIHLSELEVTDSESVKVGTV